jgi:peptidoglycan/xylan/chitin deacetylase (PgdA/CDA1 family)
MYHQVDDIPIDPWELAVHPKHFEQQLHHLKRHYNVIPLRDLYANDSSGKIKNKSVVITFDDGFRDNFVNAKPLLEKYNLPASFFITTSAIEKGTLYWWDELQKILLEAPALPSTLVLSIRNEKLEFDLSDEAQLTEKLREEIRQWYYGQLLTNKRLQLYLKLWEEMKPLSHSEQQDVLLKLRQWSSLESIEGPKIMSLKQLQELRQNSLFTIGAHTLHHPMLAARPEQEQIIEIAESKRILERWLGKSITSFAYPYGNYNSITKSAVEKSGFVNALCTAPKVVTNSSDVFELPRVQVKNWDEKRFAQNIRYWFNHSEA